jgi:dephospho-CoA kinase
VIGISGGIAAGKSAAAGALAGPDGLIIAADAIAHEVLESPEVTQHIAQHFGPSALGADGRPDRAALASAVFADPAKREQLEGWIHPAVRARISALLSRARAEAIPVVVLDVPLLFENDADHHLVDVCDALVFVDAPASVREARAMRDRGWAAGEVARREAAQLPLEDKRAASHFVLSNDGDLNTLKLEADRVLETLQS